MAMIVMRIRLEVPAGPRTEVTATTVLIIMYMTPRLTRMVTGMDSTNNPTTEMDAEGDDIRLRITGKTQTNNLLKLPKQCRQTRRGWRERPLSNRPPVYACYGRRCQKEVAA